MTKLSDHPSSRFVKAMYIGDSGTGKTGSLVSLVKAGYKLRIIDFDNGLDILKNYILQECPEYIDNVDFVTIRDKYKASAVGFNPRSPTAIIRLAKLLDKWSDDTAPAEWGPDHILIIDSLTSVGKAAFEWARAQNPQYKEARLWYKPAQDLVENIIAAVFDDEFNTNVIIISHVDIRENNDIVKGFVSSVGQALGDKLPRYTNTLICAERTGKGTNVKRKIKTVPTTLLDLKTAAPMKIEAEYDLSTGLATLFKQLKG